MSLALPSLEEIQNIVDINEAKALLQATYNYEHLLDKELESFLQNSEELESKLETVEDIPYAFFFLYFTNTKISFRFFKE